MYIHQKETIWFSLELDMVDKCESSTSKGHLNV